VCVCGGVLHLESGSSAPCTDSVTRLHTVTHHPLAPLFPFQVGHVLARHHAERISQMNATGLVNLLLRLLLGVSIPGPLIMLGMFLPYSR